MSLTVNTFNERDTAMSRELHPLNPALLRVTRQAGYREALALMVAGSVRQSVERNVIDLIAALFGIKPEDVYCDLRFEDAHVTGRFVPLSLPPAPAVVALQADSEVNADELQLFLYEEGSVRTNGHTLLVVSRDRFIAITDSGVGEPMTVENEKIVEFFKTGKVSP